MGIHYSTQSSPEQLANLKRRWPCRTLTERFWIKVNMGLKTSCWEWKARRSNQNYGQFQIQVNLWEYAHRMAYCLAKGSIPRDSVVMHLCDNPPCCNPDHLKLGTQAENMADMWSKRRTKGNAHEDRSQDKPVEGTKRSTMEISREVGRYRTSHSLRRQAARLGFPHYEPSRVSYRNPQDSMGMDSRETGTGQESTKQMAQSIGGAAMEYDRRVKETDKCKQCGFRVDSGCTHPQCEDAHEKGFCTQGCMRAYEAIKDYELSRAQGD